MREPEEDPGEAARQQARTPGNAHRRRVLNALLAAWDAHPDMVLEQVIASAAPRAGGLGPAGYATDAQMLAGLRALAEKR